MSSEPLGGITFILVHSVDALVKGAFIKQYLVLSREIATNQRKQVEEEIMFTLPTITGSRKKKSNYMFD